MGSDVVGTMGRAHAPVVERLAHKILVDCLVNDGSVLTPGAPIWNLSNLTELHRDYVDAADPSAGSFAEKLALQLADVSDPARQLFAELYVLNLLPTTNLKQTTKLGYVQGVLDPITPPIPITDEIREAFAEGVFNGGRAWTTRGWAQLSFLVEFAEHFKAQDPAVKQNAISDPLLLRKLVMEAPGHKESAQRRALLYLFHPGYFLPIVAADHLRRLRDGLAADYLVDGPTDDIDADLHQIDLAAITQTGHPVDYYDDDWRPRWLPDPGPGGGAGPPPAPPLPFPPTRPYSIADIVNDGCFHDPDHLREVLKRWEDKKNLILQGAPGTGKTWLAKRLAYALIGSEAADALRSVQFHPNTSYEDFVRGWRPMVAPDGTGRLELTDGALIQHAERARRSDIPHVLVIEEINRGNPAQAFGEMLTLLEATMRTPRDALTLSYPRSDDERFYLPDNFYIIGTMNIADRSLALVDFALRRRFCFDTLAPAFTSRWVSYLHDKLPNDPALVGQIRANVEQLNRRIGDDPTLGPQFAVGHSFFTPTTTQSRGRDWFLGVVDTEVAPLLAEYWFDDRQVASQAVADLKALG